MKKYWSESLKKHVTIPSKTPLQDLCSSINQAIKNGQIIIWNPVTKEVLSDHNIIDATMNGDSIQINLSKTDHK